METTNNTLAYSPMPMSNPTPHQGNQRLHYLQWDDPTRFQQYYRYLVICEVFNIQTKQTTTVQVCIHTKRYIQIMKDRRYIYDQVENLILSCNKHILEVIPGDIVGISDMDIKDIFMSMIIDLGNM